MLQFALLPSVRVAVVLGQAGNRQLIPLNCFLSNLRPTRVGIVQLWQVGDTVRYCDQHRHVYTFACPFTRLSQSLQLKVA